MTDRQLINLAEQASRNAYVPYSHFAVGAALECRDGTVYTGCNVENAALGSTICAERTAACKAISEGRRDFVRIAVYGDGEHYCYPCGACRQFLAEFAPDMEVLSAMGGGRYVSNRLSELMPYTFIRHGARTTAHLLHRRRLPQLHPCGQAAFCQPLDDQPRCVRP